MWQPAARKLRILIALFILLSGRGWIPANPGAIAAQAASPNPAFLPITLVDPGAADLTGGGYINEVQISGDWVRYRRELYREPWLSPIAGPNIELVNALTGQPLIIHAAFARVAGYQYMTGTYTDLQFAAPRLVWTQLDRATGEQIGTFYPGDFDCTRCYYDLRTGQGGAWTGGTLPSDPPSPWAVTVEAAPAATVPDTIRVTQRSTGQVVLHETLGYVRASHSYGDPYPTALRVPAVASSADKLVWVERGEESADPNPQAIRLVWLLPPDPAFGRVWARADAAVAAGQVPRSWLWGPAPRYAGNEAYAEGPGGAHQVLYYDKARMEVNTPGANPAAPSDVTNGLLSVEMIGGALQIGNAATIPASVPCTIPVAGDPRAFNPLTPDYPALAGVASLHGEHQAPNRAGQPVGDALDVHGIISPAPAQAGQARYATFVPQTGHNIPDVFWRYLQSMPATYGFDWPFVVGYPIMEGYWTQMRVGGKDYAVLIQAYQRRVLTYVPAFAPPGRSSRATSASTTSSGATRSIGHRPRAKGCAGPGGLRYRTRQPGGPLPPPRNSTLTPNVFKRRNTGKPALKMRLKRPLAYVSG
jgi:hypothetical protein